MKEFSLEHRPKKEATVNPVERAGWATSIDMPEAKYVLAYQKNHTEIQNPNIIPNDSDVVFMEYVGVPGMGWNSNLNIKDDLYKVYAEPYQEVLPKLIQHRIPVGVLDVDLKVFAGGLDWAGALLAVNAGPLLGLATISDTVKMVANEEKRTRKDFLKTLSKGALAAYFSSYLPNNIIGESSNTDENAELRKKQEAIHPEIHPVILGFRNSLYAYKEQWYADKLKEKLPHKPIITTTIGSGHIGLENRLQETQGENLETLIRCKPFLDKIVATPETFYSIFLNYPDGTDETIVIPELKQLWDKSVE